MRKKDGKAFELLTKEIYENLSSNNAYTSVEHNVKLLGKDGERQIDVLLRAEVAGLSILTIIECKDEKKNLDVTYIDALHSKMQDVNANKAVLVARKGFSKTAMQKAERLGITLCTAIEGKSALWDVGFHVPIVVKEVLPQVFLPSFRAFLNAGTEISFDPTIMINNQSVYHAFRDSLVAGEIDLEMEYETQIWSPQSSNYEFYMYDAHGSRINIESLTVQFQLQTVYYFGYLHDLESAKVLINKTDNKGRIMFKVGDLFEYKSALNKFTNKNLIPKVNSI